MNIVSIIKGHKPFVKKSYPYIGATDKVIVMFTAPKAGFVLGKFDGKSNDYNVGDHLTSWDENLFGVFEGEVLLRNDLSEKNLLEK